jgi:hypothetical protein
LIDPWKNQSSTLKKPVRMWDQHNRGPNNKLRKNTMGIVEKKFRLRKSYERDRALVNKETKDYKGRKWQRLSELPDLN